MADKKISQLTGASTPLAGTEVLPIVQSGATVKVAVSDLTAARAVATAALSATGIVSTTDATDASSTTAASLKTAGGLAVVKKTYIGDNIVQGTAARGFNFTDNTPTAGMTSQLLNWYEEGTWTPTLTFGGAAVGVTYGANAGTYTRIGNVVTGRFILGLSSKGSSSGSAVISGLPFTVNASNLGSAVVELALNFNVAMVSSGYCGDNTTTISLFTWGPTGMSAATDLNFANNTRLDMWIQYNI